MQLAWRTGRRGHRCSVLALESFGIQIKEDLGCVGSMSLFKQNYLCTYRPYLKAGGAARRIPAWIGNTEEAEGFSVAQIVCRVRDALDTEPRTGTFASRPADCDGLTDSKPKMAMRSLRHTEPTGSSRQDLLFQGPRGEIKKKKREELGAI